MNSISIMTLALFCIVSTSLQLVSGFLPAGASFAPLRFLDLDDSPRCFSKPWASKLSLLSDRSLPPTTRRYSNEGDHETNMIRNYLGKGENAVVRNGVVLVAPAHEYHHFYRHAAIFIYGMGPASSPEGEEYLIRGVIIDHPTPFNLKEMLDRDIGDNPLGEARLFRGGEKGGEGVLLLHNNKAGANELAEIGTSGLYQGGWDAAIEACAAGRAQLQDFKVFFNYCEFTERELENMLVLDAEGDGWTSVEVNPELVLSAEWARGGAWARLRNAVRQYELSKQHS